MGASNIRIDEISENAVLHVIIDSGGGGGGGGGDVAIADGDDAAQGAKADTAYASANGSAAGSVIAVLKGIYVRLTNALGTNSDGVYTSADATANGSMIALLKGIYLALKTGGGGGGGGDVNITQIGGENIPPSRIPVKVTPRSPTNFSFDMTGSIDSVGGADYEAFVVLHNPVDNDPVKVALTSGADPDVDGITMAPGERWQFDFGLGSGFAVKGTAAERFVVYGNN